MSLPSSVGLPTEMQQGHLDFSLPPDAKSYSVRVQPTNLQSVAASFATTTVASANQGDIPFVTQNIIFDLPCGGSPSMFIDSRMTTLNFTANFAITSGGGSKYADSYLRSGAYAWFDRMYITNSTGSIIEDVTEYALVNDTLCALQMNVAARHGCANQYGFDTATSGNLGCQGHMINVLSSANGSPTTGQTETHSYSIPLASGIIGVLCDKFLNVGRTSKLQLVIQTAPIMPITVTNTTGTITANTFQVTLSNFFLQCEYVDVGINALQLLDQTLVDGKAYLHGVTYRTTSATLPSGVTGSTSLLAGLRASSVKSLFARFAQIASASTTNSSNGKFDSVNPIASGINFNVGGIRYPQTPVNPLLMPSASFRETSMAIGSFNNSQFQTSIPPSQYCKISAGGTAQSLTVGATQDWNWSLGSTTAQLSQFIFGECVEIVARRGLLSGLNCTSAPIFLEMNIAAAPTNTHTAYVIGMLDHVIIHDIASGDIQVRI